MNLFLKEHKLTKLTQYEIANYLRKSNSVFKISP